MHRILVMPRKNWEGVGLSYSLLGDSEALQKQEMKAKPDFEMPKM